MNNMDIIQLKLVSGCEIVCEVMEWPKDDSGIDGEMVIRHVFQMSLLYSDEEEVKYGLKPWMTMQDGDMQCILLSSRSIIARSKPTTHFRQEFVWAIEQSRKIRKGRDIYYAEVMKHEAEHMKSLKKSIDNITNGFKDSSSNNVLSFPTFDSDTNIH